MTNLYGHGNGAEAERDLRESPTCSECHALLPKHTTIAGRACSGGSTSRSSPVHVHAPVFAVVTCACGVRATLTGDGLSTLASYDFNMEAIDKRVESYEALKKRAAAMSPVVDAGKQVDEESEGNPARGPSQRALDHLHWALETYKALNQ